MVYKYTYAGLSCRDNSSYIKVAMVIDERNQQRSYRKIFLYKLYKTDTFYINYIKTLPFINSSKYNNKNFILDYEGNKN